MRRIAVSQASHQRIHEKGCVACSYRSMNWLRRAEGNKPVTGQSDRLGGQFAVKGGGIQDELETERKGHVRQAEIVQMGSCEECAER